jgi:hypothetical protein
MYVYWYGVYHAMVIRPKQLPNFIVKEQRQGSFHQSLVAIGPVVSEEKIFM